MKINYFGLVVIIIFLLLNNIILGCKNSKNNENSTGSKNLVEVWVNVDDEYGIHEMFLENGKFTEYINGMPLFKGSYTIRNKSFISTLTHMGGQLVGLDLYKWYSDNELIEKGIMQEKYIESSADYSSDGNIMTIIEKSEDGENYITTFEKKIFNMFMGLWTGYDQDSDIINIYVSNSNFIIFWPDNYQKSLPQLDGNIGYYSINNNIATLKNDNSITFGTATVSGENLEISINGLRGSFIISKIN